MTLPIIPAAELRPLVDALRAVAWPLDRAGARALAAALGWGELAGTRDETTFLTGLDFPQPLAKIRHANAWDYVVVNVSASSAEDAPAVGAAFEALAEAMAALLGEADGAVDDPAERWWRLPSGGSLDLQHLESVVVLRLSSPQRAAGRDA